MLFINGNVFLNGKFSEADFRVEDGKFTAICHRQSDSSSVSVSETFSDGEIVDCRGMKIIPGLFDIHTHGCLGNDFSLSSAQEDNEMCGFYAAHGVTSVLATTMTNPLDKYRKACEEIRSLILSQKERTLRGARIQGINMEGPFLSEKKRGAHDPKQLYPVSETLFDELNKLSGCAIRLLTIAPELAGAMDFIKKHSAVCDNGSISCDADHQVISIGHSACDYAVASEAFQCGANHVTHLYNAMFDPAHREPGIVGAAADSGAYVELICDGLHVHESIIRNAFRANPGRVVMISDSINPTGLPEGRYSAGGLDVFMKNGEIRLADGTLAGSSITLFEGMVRCIKNFRIPEEEAVCAATCNPADSVGLGNRCGRIAEGLAADFLIVDNDYTLQKVYLNGEIFGRS